MINEVINSKSDWAGEFLYFRHQGKLKPGASTQVWAVEGSISRSALGIVRWMANWRCYAYYTTGLNVIMDAKCLLEIGQFTKLQTDRLKATWPMRGEQKRKPVLELSSALS